MCRALSALLQQQQPEEAQGRHRVVRVWSTQTYYIDHTNALCAVMILSTICAMRDATPELRAGHPAHVAKWSVR